MKLVAIALAASASAVAILVACGGDVVLGDDTAPPDGDGGADARPPTDAREDATSTDAGVDASERTCASEGGTCGPPGNGFCKKVDTTGLTCANVSDTCCLVSCPELQQPPPGFCDAGPVAQTFAANGCVNGFVCAPTTCVAAGGSCVGLAPGNCPSNNIGDATKYSCGGGVGTMCCLP